MMVNYVSGGKENEAVHDTSQTLIVQSVLKARDIRTRLKVSGNNGDRALIKAAIPKNSKVVHKS
jgi:hypothetical protein